MSVLSCDSDGANGSVGYVTPDPKGAPIEIATLRALFRNLQAFRSTYELYGVDTVRQADGTEWSLWDLEYLLNEGVSRLTKRQQEAIWLCYIYNLKERDAAVTMGVSDTNPVGMYANKGLAKLVLLIESGELPRFRTGRVNGTDEVRGSEVA